MKKLLLLLTLLAAISPAHAALKTFACRPKAPWTHFTFGSVAATDSSRYDSYAAWVCETPSGYQTYAVLFNLAGSSTVFLKYAAGQMSSADADTDCAQSCVDSTDSESKLLQSLLARYRPPALVAFNGKPQTQPVFSIKADGTVGTAVAGQSVAVASRCDERKRIVGSNNPNGTGLYSVAGLPNASQSGSTLGDVYAVCTVSTPIGVN